MHLYEPKPFAPLPGTVPSPRGLFVDRWGTLLCEPEEGKLPSAADLRFHEGAIDALFRAHRAGWLVYVIGNELDVAFGRLSDSEWQAIEARYLGELEAHGVAVQRQYACIDHPQGAGGHRFDSVFLLPNTGLLFHAAHNDGIAIAKSWVIGDSTLELVAGWRAGVRTAGVRTGRALSDGEFNVQPEFVADDLAQAVLGVLGQRQVELV
jgi:histidinol phosphatase-like enzyme